jgi:hypothetical protein
MSTGKVFNVLIPSFTFQLCIRIFHYEGPGKLKLNGTHQLLAYADDVNLLRDNIDTIKKNTETLIDASKEVGLEINVNKTKYMLLSRHQNVVMNIITTIRNIYKSYILRMVVVIFIINILRNRMHSKKAFKKL